MGNVKLAKPNIVVVATSKWMDNKLEPSEYSLEQDTIYVRANYDMEKDLCGWLIHEYAHSYGVKLGVNPYGANYPCTEIEQFAFGLQFDYLVSKGVTLLVIMSDPAFAALKQKFLDYPVVGGYWNMAEARAEFAQVGEKSSIIYMDKF